jgi:PAS domain S-box-containing protein
MTGNDDTLLHWLSIENANDGIYVIDLRGKVLHVNRAFCAMLGYSRDELECCNIHDWDTSFDPGQMHAELVELTDQRKILHTAYRRRDGSSINVEVAVAASYVGGNAVVHCACRDLSDTRRTADALAESERRFCSLMQQSIAGVYIVQDGELVYVNPHFAGMFGYDSDSEIKGRKVEDLVASQWREQVIENMNQRLSGNCHRTHLEFVALRRDGSEFEVSADGAVATYHGRPALVGLIEDMSGHQKTADALKAYVSKLELAVLGTVQVASSMVEMRDPYTAGHERRVGEIAAAIGRKMKLDSHRIEGLRIIGQVHDIGKIGIPAEILSKPGRLSRSEMDLIREHSQKGYEILKTVEYPWPIADAVLQHHERMDGSGYPQGLSGDEIVIEARIMAVADTIEAMSAHRPYRAGLGLDAALNEIERGNGIQYDPESAEACLQLFREDCFSLPA